MALWERCELGPSLGSVYSARRFADLQLMQRLRGGEERLRSVQQPWPLAVDERSSLRFL